MININRSQVFLTLLFLLTTTFGFIQSSKFKVTLDAGHGGKDFGAVYTGYIEKNIALAVVTKVGAILEDKPGFVVNYTRKTDVFIDLIERANIANRADANIFVSIHCNASNNRDAAGTETFVMGMSKNASNLEAAKKENAVITLEKDYKEKYEGFDPSSPESLIGMTLMQEEYLENSIALASKVQDEFTNDLKKRNRGVKQAPFMVLHKAYMPRVLIEMGFISNAKDGAYLGSEEGQNEIAMAIANAIISYKNEYYGSGVADNSTTRPSQRVPRQAPASVETPSAVVETPVKNNPITSGVVFKVQIAASGTKLDLTPTNFKGLDEISVMTDGGNLYKYMYGETSDYNIARQKVSEARAKGFESAYLVAFKDGKKITVQEALK